MAPRSTGSFIIGVSLVGVGVKVYKAIETPGAETAMKQLCPTCKVPTQQKLNCEKCGVIAYSDLAKGVPVGNGSYLVFTDEEIKALQGAKTEKVEIIQFCDEDEIDSIYLEDGIYYLAPEKGSGSAFATFRNSLDGRAAIGDYTTKGHDHRVAISQFNNVLVMRYLRPHKEVRTPADIPKYDDIPADGDPKHTKLMGMLIDSLTGAFDPTALIDTYSTNFNKMVEAKGAGTEYVVPVEEVKEKESDLMAALEASLAATKPVEKVAKVVAIKRKKTKKKAA